MTDYNHAYLTELTQKRGLATNWEGTWNEWVEFAEQMTVAYPQWIELYNAAVLAYEGDASRLGNALRSLEQFSRETVDSEV